MKKLSFINKIIFLINTFFALLLFISYNTQYIKPSSLIFLPLLSLITPALIVINILFVCYWMFIGIKRQFFLSFIILIFGYFVSPSLYTYGSDTNDSEKETLSIMTYNVRKFNMLDWIKDENISSKIDSFVRKENPDIVAIQESQNSTNFIANYPYNFIPHTRNNVKIGLEIYSKYRIVNNGIVNLGRHTGRVIFADIEKNNDTIRVYTFHLQSLGVAPDEEYFGHPNSKKLFRKLMISLKLQQYQINNFVDHVKNCKYKVILSGDMNNTAYSWAYKNLKGDLQDSYIKKGKGFGKTYSFKGFPMRIDYIFADTNMKILNHKNYTVKYSDHYPIMATVEF